MDQICKEDERYPLLLKIRPITVNPIYRHVYEIQMSYKPFYTTLFVDIGYDPIMYTFCYDSEENPEIYHEWIRK